MEEATKLLSDIIQGLAKNAATALAKKAKDFLIDMGNKEQIDVGEAYEDYLRNVYDTYSKSKSVIYINEARELRKFFVPSNLMYEKNMPVQGRISLKKSGSYTLSGKNIEDVFERTNKIIITGIGGLGKTMHMKHFCISAIEDGFKIPVFIPLRWFNDHNIEEEPLEKLIYDRLEEFGFKLDYKYFKYSLESDKYVFLLDGYDEISKAKINQVSNRIQSFSHRYSDNNFIISSREIDKIYGWDDYIVYSLCRLKYSDAVQLIWKLDFAVDMKKRFIDDLSNAMFIKYESIASVPLLLSIMYMTYVDNTTFPDSLDAFYDKAFDTMLYGHDRRQKTGFEREFSSELGYTDFKEVFKAFCFRTYFNDEYSFSENTLIDNINAVRGVSESSFTADEYKDDLVDITCMLIREGFEYAFIHRSFQEFFAASYVSKMLEDEQREFCFSYLDSLDDELIFYRDSVNGDSVTHPVNNKAIDFLNILCSINQNAFKHIIIEPILEKIYCRYISCKKDLIGTVASYFYIYQEEMDRDEFMDHLGFKFDKKHKDQITAQEYNVLCSFFRRLYKLDIPSYEEIRKLYYQIPEKEKAVEDIYRRELSHSDIYSCYDNSSVEALLALICTAVNKYECINKNRKETRTFSERVNNPRYYSH